MAITIDQKNPGSRQIQRFSVAGGLDTNKGDQETKGVSFLVLQNCLVDKRIAAVVKRPGSNTEVVTGAALGIPLGIGEFSGSSIFSSIPVSNTLLSNFSGVFYQYQAGTWSGPIAQTAYVNFATSTLSQFTKLASKLFIAGGLPAKWLGPGQGIDRVGTIPPTTAVTTTFGPGAVVLTTGTQYVYTFFDSATSRESDWSPLSTNTGPVSGQSIILAIPTLPAGNYDRINIYRTLDGGGTVPFFVATLPVSATTFTDTANDDSLTAQAPIQFDNLPPPTQSFICTKFAQCIWWVDAANPYKIVFSKPYTDNEADLEYYPIDNFLISNEQVTGLVVVPGKMLVFHPRSISLITGFSKDDFTFQPYLTGVGTVFPNSVSTNGKDIVFLAEEGFVSLGRDPMHLSREIDLDLQPLLAGTYNSQIYVSSCWNPSLRQFVFMINAAASAAQGWEVIGTGAAGPWETAAHADDVWEDSSNPGATDNMRIKIWGWSPELSGGTANIWMEYTFPFISDLNTSGNYPTFLFHPLPSSDVNDPQQDKTFCGFYYTGVTGGIYTLFRKDTFTDSGSLIPATIVTGRLVPGEDKGGCKLFQKLGFNNSYSDPTSDGFGTIKYLLDFDDPQSRTYSGSLVTFTDLTDEKKFPTMQGKHLHLVITDNSSSQTKILLSEFYVQYRERFRRESR